MYFFHVVSDYSKGGYQWIFSIIRENIDGYFNFIIGPPLAAIIISISVTILKWRVFNDR